MKQNCQFICILVTLICVKYSADAQTFKGTAEVFPKSKSQFYKVRLTPDMKSMMKPDFSDIRLLDIQNNEIPYIMQTRIPRFSDYDVKKDKYPEDDTSFYTLLKSPKIKEISKKNDKTSIFEISFAETQYIDAVRIEVETPQFYRRDCSLDTIYASGKDSVKSSFRNFIISSDHANRIVLNNTQLKVFYLTVNNFDDQPIQIKYLKCYQLNTFIIANLKTNSTYIVKFGDKKLKPAVYDLSYFTEKIPEKLEILTPKNVKIKNIETKIPIKIEPEKPNDNMTLIWIVIIVVIIIVGFFTIQIVRESKNKKME